MPKKPRANALAIFIILVGLLAVGGVFIMSMLRHATKPTGRAVAATIFPLYDIVRNVAGTSANVTLILPPNAEPHSFEPKPSTIEAIVGSSAVYAVGHGLDDWIRSTAEIASAPVVVVDHGIHIRPSVVPFQDVGGQSETGPDDPHYWLDPKNAKQIAANVAADLSMRFPDQATAIHANLLAYQSRLDALDIELKAELAAVRNRNLITFHGAWYYFAEAFGLTVAGTFEPAANREPTPKYLTALAAAIHATKVRTVYVEPQFSADSFQAFIEEYQLKLVALDDLGGTPGRESYESLLRYDAQSIANNQ